MYKIIYGIPAMMLPLGFTSQANINDKGHIEDYIIEDDMDMWCDFELDYYPEENFYSFEFETMLGFEGEDGCRNWIIKCLSCLTDYMNKNGYDISKELNMYEVFTEGVDIHTHFETIEEAYAWLKMMVFGFNGKGLNL